MHISDEINVLNINEEKDKLINNLLEQNTEDKIIESMDFIYNFIKYKGILNGINKKDFINKVKDLKEKVKDVWNKNISQKFGNLLKFINLIEKIKIKFNQSNVQSKSYDVTIKGCINDINMKFDDNENKRALCNFLRRKVMKICAVSDHVIMFTESGDVYGWGKNSFGQLGFEDANVIESIRKLTHIKENDDIIEIPKVTVNDKVSCGYAFTFMIINGKTYSFGAGENGRLGNNSTENTYIPTKINCDKMIKIVSGSTHTVGISENFKLYACGDFKYTGHNLDEDVLTLKEIDFNGILFEDVSIGTGGYHTIALTKSGEVYTWGHNRVGQLGFKSEKDGTENFFIHKNPKLVENIPPIIKISAGWGHSMLLTLDKNVLVCGRMQESQLGNIISTNGVEFYVNDRNHKYNPYFNKLNIDFKVNNIKSGGNHNAIFSENGELYMWGCNDEDQLDIEKGNTNDLIKISKYSNVQLGFSYTIFLK